MKAATVTHSGMTMCQYRSPVRSACQAFAITTIVATTYGGAVRRSVMMFEKPRVSTTDGKKFLVFLLGIEKNKCSRSDVRYRARGYDSE